MTYISSSQHRLQTQNIQSSCYLNTELAVQPYILQGPEGVISILEGSMFLFVGKMLIIPTCNKRNTSYLVHINLRCGMIMSQRLKYVSQVV